MAVITISRQFASLGDEVSSLVAKKLNYKFLGRKDIENKIVEKGFPKEKLGKYDEKMPGFFASLAKDRDEYLDYLQTVILEEASLNDCVIVGRGSFVILSDLANHLSFRIVSPLENRLERTKNEFNIDEKKASKMIVTEDKKRVGFHKSFFNYSVDDPELYHAVLNTGLFSVEEAAQMIAESVKDSITDEKEKSGKERVEELLVCQRIVNMLILDYNLSINFLRATVKNGKVTLHGVADSSAIVNRALMITQAELPEYNVVSAINVVQDFKAYQ